ncbi:hypothetical protein U1Q18_024158 [Sarracenia purpurea var. burkii]
MRRRRKDSGEIWEKSQVVASKRKSDRASKQATANCNQRVLQCYKLSDRSEIEISVRPLERWIWIGRITVTGSVVSHRRRERLREVEEQWCRRGLSVAKAELVKLIATIIVGSSRRSGLGFLCFGAGKKRKGGVIRCGRVFGNLGKRRHKSRRRKDFRIEDSHKSSHVKSLSLPSLGPSATTFASEARDDVARTNAAPSLRLLRQREVHRLEGPNLRERHGGPYGGGAEEGRGGGGGALLVAGLRELAGGGAADVEAGEGRLQPGSAGDRAGVPRRLLGLYGMEGPLRVQPVDGQAKGLRGGLESGHDVYSSGCGSR